MIPAPGETAGQWWEATGHQVARVQAGLGQFEAPKDFFHDVSPDIEATAMTWPHRSPSDRSFTEPWPAKVWPSVPTLVLQGRDDRLFPLAFVRRLARERLGAETIEMPGGHLLALSRPDELARRLAAL
ncbi:alpha/beta hydrolase [Kineosporia sp. NBRC 101731]|uniref:alpha/beta hydrolase n=1 Tax=Kineosporia sp. NBRC 101731 TaxID=3032199 RepID=UPI0025563843|nr:alpha/beta hydrolase [Kineosporia sp. NBRC 101731]